MEIHYIKEKREQNDFCNICGEKTKLTWDHVPPRGITNGDPVIANTIFENLPVPNRHMKNYQSGIKYRSICPKCNNVVLGENDKVYQEFIIAVREQVESRLFLNSIVVPVKINRLCRAMIGHMLAAKNTYQGDVIPDQKMREYVLDETLRLTGLMLYTWLYPYKTIVITRDFVAKGFYSNTHPEGMVSGVVAAYPLAYMISDEKSECSVDDLGECTTAQIDDVVDVRLHFETLYITGTQEYKPFNWPVNIDNDKRISAMVAIGGPVLHDDSRLGLKK